MPSQASDEQLWNANTEYVSRAAVLDLAAALARQQQDTQPAVGQAGEDGFAGDNAKLIESIEALLSLDAAGTLAPHGIGGHARTLLTAAASRLGRSESSVPCAIGIHKWRSLGVRGIVIPWLIEQCQRCKCGRETSFTGTLTYTPEQMADAHQQGDGDGRSREVRLEGKDWFTEAEAAAYCGVALRPPSAPATGRLGIAPRRAFGKKLYSRADLYHSHRPQPRMATLYQRGKSWYLSWAEGGEQFRRSLGPIEAREAERVRSAKEAELRHGVRILPRLPTVQQFMDFYGDWYKAEHPTTHRRLLSEVKPFLRAFGHRPIDTIRPAEVEAWKAEQLKTRAPETVGKELRRFKAAFKRGMDWGELDCNPVATVKAPRGARSVAVRFYTVAQVGMLAKTRRGPLWRFLACTGLRRGEAVQVLQSRDVVADGAQTVIRVESDARREPARAAPSPAAGARSR